MSELLAVSGDDFAGVATHEATTINVALRGNADYAALDALETLLTRVHSEGERLAITDAVVDLRNLEFMNSSCFKSFVSWVTDIQELPESRRYKIRFLSNPKFHWQKRSLHSLRCFAVELITVAEQ